jgi:hypothetical protein
MNSQLCVNREKNRTKGNNHRSSQSQVGESGRPAIGDAGAAADWTRPRPMGRRLEVGEA